MLPSFARADDYDNCPDLGVHLGVADAAIADARAYFDEGKPSLGNVSLSTARHEVDVASEYVGGCTDRIGIMHYYDHKIVLARVLFDHKIIHGDEAASVSMDSLTQIWGLVSKIKSGINAYPSPTPGSVEDPTFVAQLNQASLQVIVNFYDQDRDKTRSLYSELHRRFVDPSLASPVPEPTST